MEISFDIYGPHRNCGLLVHKAMAAAVPALAAIMDAHDEPTAAHMRRVGALSAELGRRLELAGAELTMLRWGGGLHDIGKLAVGPSTLRKPEPLTPLEQHRIERHPAVGDYIARLLPDPTAVLPAIRHHHERLDGSGYPDGLAGTAIPLQARIVAVADAFDAMTNPRPYQPLRSPKNALAELAADANRLWDAAVIAALAGCLESTTLMECRVGERLMA